MPTVYTFILPGLAVETIGAHLPTFAQKLVLLDDQHWDVSRQPDGRFVIRCQRDAAMGVVKLLQAAGRSPVGSVEKTMSCIEGAASILFELNRAATEEWRDEGDRRL